VGYGISFLTPAAKVGGEPVRVAILQREGVDITKATSATLIDKIMEISLNGIFFIIGLMLFALIFDIPLGLRIAIPIFCGLIIALIVYFYVQMFSAGSFVHRFFRMTGLYKLKFIGKQKRKIKEVDDLMVTFFKEHRKHFFWALMATLASWVFMFVEYKSALAILGHSITIPQVFIIFSVVGASYLIPVPLALGTLEASQVSLFALLKKGTAVGLALALLIKVRELLFTAIGMIFLSVYGLNFKKAYDEAVKDTIG
jgi:uncharacterized membrane protein YbhN (UPF0104 family)